MGGPAVNSWSGSCQETAKLGQACREAAKIDAMRGIRDVLPRGALTVILLAVALVASSLLAWQAYDSAASHRTATEAVLRDYAGLAAAELVRRAASEVGYQGHYVLVQALSERTAAPQGLVIDTDPRTKRASALVRRTFTADPASRAVQFQRAEDPEVAAWLAQRLASPREGQPFSILQGVVSGETRMFVLSAPRDGRIVGYEVEPRALGSFIATVVDRAALLPSSLGRGGVGNARLAVVVRDAADREIYRHGTGWSGRLRVRLPFGDAYSSVLQGFTAEVEIDPAAAPNLVIGGLPRSRLPVVVALLGLAAGLLVGAVLQLRRERALERLRAEFVASASHELRTPLTQIRMFAETLRLDRVRSEEERRQYLEIIDREARRLGHLLENLLQFSRSGGGARSLALNTQELAPLVAEIVASFRPVAVGAGARLTTRLASGLQARVDADAWRQVLLNLLDNAVKYGPRGQEVAVTLEGAGGGLRLAVEDEGPGIPPDERERVFERFHRLERDRASAVAGTGLGLAVVRELVTRHGGRCVVESSRRGGARVVVELPVAVPEARP
jgi:signal transduction histidine kinase